MLLELAINSIQTPRRIVSNFMSNVEKKKATGQSLINRSTQLASQPFFLLNSFKAQGSFFKALNLANSTAPDPDPEKLLQTINDSFAIYHKADKKAQESIKEKLLKDQKWDISLAAKLIRQRTNYPERMPEIKALMGHYQRMGILQTVLNSKYKKSNKGTVGNKRISTIGAKVARLQNKLRPASKQRIVLKPSSQASV